MLLPSAISCDASQPRLQPSLFASPPASPPTLSHLPGSPIGNIMASCRSLQGLMGGGSYNTHNHNTADELPGSGMYQLPTPPISYAPPPLKLRLRSRGSQGKSEATSERAATPRKKVVKRTASGVAWPAPPRGANKRRRDLDDDCGRGDVSHSEDEYESDLDLAQHENTENSTPSPSTPKRARIAPEQLPLGLERSDFHNLLDSTPQESSENQQGQGDDGEDDGWTAEDDRILVELVLDKLKLSKTEWQDCARSLGRDRYAVGRRWRSLLVAGDVGIKGSRRGGPRAKLHSTWR